MPEFSISAETCKRINTQTHEIQHILLLLYYIDKCPSEEKREYNEKSRINSNTNNKICTRRV